MRPGHLVNLAPGHVSIPAGHHRGYKAHVYERFHISLSTVSENLFLRLLDLLCLERISRFQRYSIEQ